MMKRLLYCLLSFVCLTIVSCTKEIPEVDYTKNHIVVNVYNSPMTKASADNTDYERQLDRLDFFFYTKGKTNEKCVYHKTIKNPGSSSIPIYISNSTFTELYPPGSALCDVFVIANLPDDYTFASGQDGTDVESLGDLLLDMNHAKYDACGKPFIMTGAGTAQRVSDGKNDAIATISLKRIASKVTMTVKVPKSLTVKNGSTDVTMLPVLVDNEGNETLKTSFRYGVSKSYLSSAYSKADNDDYIWTDKISYTQSDELSTDEYYAFICDIPFYTYARSWEKGADNAAYVTFEMPWGEDRDKDGKVDSYKTYYYQILVNGRGRNFVPNTWYDMIVRVGVLGSAVESLPKELEELSYYVLDWTTETSNGNQGSGDRQEDVELEKYNYLEVPQTYIEMDNVSKVDIRYNASHKIGVEWDKKGNKEVYGLDGKVNDMSALYINNGSGEPVAVNMEGTITLKDPTKPDANETAVVSQFKDNNNGLLTFEYELSPEIYSPAYVFITIWLDVNGDGVHDKDEILEQDVKIVMYPAIYIIGDNSYKYSVFINGNYNSNRSGGGSLGYLKIAGQQVGKAAGDDANTYMHVISISAFNDQNYKFAYNNNKNKDTEYIIGDPRVRSSYKLGVPDDNTTVKQNADGWIKATDVNGNVRNLEYYYPTDTGDYSYQVIAPKFRISSKLGGYSHSSPAGAAYRCASYQEHGFPAGRWRLPTTAEVLYIIELQRLGKIQQLFFGGTTYLTATDRVATDNNNNYTLTTGYPNDGTPSVRCVYDEWYWGSEREAIANTSLNQNGGYQFTWGDRKIY